MSRDKRWFCFFSLAYILVLLIAVGEYYIQWRSLNVQLGVLAMVLSVTGSVQRRGNKRFAFAAAGMLGLLLLVPVKTFLYAATLCALFFAAESFAAGINHLTVLAAVFMSPVFDYLVNIFGFSIRLQLTAAAGNILRYSGSAVTVQGNIIQYGGKDYSVDPACMGLHMLVASLLSGVMLIVLYQQQYRRRLAAVWVWLVTAGIVLLNIISNLIRITCLVYFALMPNSSWHYIMGIACFGIYVLLPAVVVARWLVRTRGREPGVSPAILVKALPVWNAVLLAGIVAAAVVMNNVKPALQTNTAIAATAGYEVQLLPDNVTRLSNAQALIYVKAIRSFYATEHHPMICWRGSGYVFTRVQAGVAGGKEVYMAVLEQGGNLLYTAWWYTNGRNHTISQLNWRWDAARSGTGYQMINITCATQSDLEQEIINFTNQYHS